MDNLLQMLNSNAFPNRSGLKPRWVILHGTAGGTSAQAIASYFKSTEGSSNPVSANYVIGQDGTIVLCNQETDGAYANGYLSAGHDAWWNSNINPNNVTISIEHCKPSSDNSDALTPAQQASSFALVADICSRWNIPARSADADGGVTGHYSIDPVNRSRCPGDYPWDELFAYLKGGATLGAPQGWTDNQQTGILTAPNLHTVRDGFRAYVLANNWDPANWPLEEEHAQSPLELSNPGLGNGTQQVFRFSMLGWTSDRGVIVEYVGAELLALRAQPANVVQNAINTLKTCDALLQGAITKLSS